MPTDARPYLDLGFADAVAAERRHQDAKWGPLNGRDHTWAEWALIFNAEVGEVNEVMRKVHFWSSAHSQGYGTVYDLRSELIEVAAVCAAVVELIDRGIDQEGAE